MSEKGKEAPPAYTVNEHRNIAGPSAGELNAAFSSLTIFDAQPPFPKADHCFAHLKLLSTFHALKEEIRSTDGLFNLWDVRCEKAEARDEILEKMKDKRWALYIARAVERFESWWLRVLVQMEQSKRLEAKEMVSTNSGFRQFTKKGRIRQWTPTMLPPIGEIFFFVLRE